MFWGLGIPEALRHDSHVRWLMVVLFCGVGCKEPEGDSVPARPVPAPETIQPWEPTEAQPKLPTIKLFVGTVELAAEQCRTERQIQTGMMFRKTMTDDDAMLFVHQQPIRLPY